MDPQAGDGIAGVGKGAQDNVKPVCSFLDGSLREARNLEEAARNGGVASGVEGGRGCGLVGSDSGVGVERGGGADFDFDVVEGARGFDDAVPAEGRARFGECGSLAWRFAAVGAGFQCGQSVAVENEAQNDIK